MPPPIDYSKWDNIDTDSEDEEVEELQESFSHLRNNPYEPLIAPINKDGFVKSFTLSDDMQPAMDFFHKYGFLVIPDVLSESQCDLTFDEFWARGRSKGLVRSDPKTWQPYWDTQQFGGLGIIGNDTDLTSIRQLENRQNARLHQAFSVIYGTKKLCIDHDRLGVMRPTKGIDLGDGVLREIKSWRTISDWLHLDCNPSTGYANIGGFVDDRSQINFKETLLTQSLLTLTDARIEDGGFHCVPGSHKFSYEWAVANQEQDSHPRHMKVPMNDPLRQNIQQIPIKKGCLLIWTSLLMYGNHPNESDIFRAVQYFRVMPMSGTPFTPMVTHKKYYPKNFIPTDLGAKMFGLKPWD